MRRPAVGRNASMLLVVRDSTFFVDTTVDEQGVVSICGGVDHGSPSTPKTTAKWSIASLKDPFLGYKKVHLVNHSISRDSLNMILAGVVKRPSCKSSSRTCRQSKRSTLNRQCASPSTLLSESSQPPSLALSRTCLGKHSHPARDVGLSWKHHSRYSRGSSL